MPKALYTTLTYETFKSVDEFMTHNLSGPMVDKSGKFKNKLGMMENENLKYVECQVVALNYMS